MRRLTLALIFLYCNTANAGIAIGETGKGSADLPAQILDAIWHLVEILKANI